MGKMKEKFMQEEYGDLEREYLFNDILAQEPVYEEEIKVKKEDEKTKIEIGETKYDGTNKEKLDNNKEDSLSKLGL